MQHRDKSEMLSGKDSKQGRWTPHNPLGVIALFVFLIETVATVSLHTVAEKPFASVLVWFIVLYPIGIAITFFLLLWFKREALFGPMDFTDQSEFSRLLLQKVERIEVKQDVARIDSDVAFNDIFRAVEKLLQLDDPWSAINIGRAYLKRREYEKSLKVFEYVKDRIEPADESYHKVLANVAYAQIGLNRNKEATDNLLQLRKSKRAMLTLLHCPTGRSTDSH
jgi:tetratricopeptide (TPR) repeat protein